MSKKRMLNVTSIKKRDTMMTFSNTNGNGLSQSIALGNLNVNGTSAAFVLFCPTARTLVQFGGGSNTIVQESARTATTCFMRGYKENIRVQTSSGLPWLWRRICFRYRGLTPFIAVASSDTPTQPPGNYVETSNGYQRLAFNQYVNNQPGTTGAQKSVLFKGTEGVDWNDVMTAPIDTRRVDLSYDKYRRISSGNSNGILRDYKIWMPMNKNISYQDDEQGEVETTSAYSVADKRGMGDYYVLDIIQPGYGGAAADIITIGYEASLYWHEK